jgi:cell surface hyaluronidase
MLVLFLYPRVSATWSFPIKFCTVQPIFLLYSPFMKRYLVLLSLVALAACGGSVPAGSGVLEKWSDPKTWGGTVPVSGANLVIPAGKQVLLDVSVNLGALEIAGELRFDNLDLELRAKSIMVHGGKLQVGSSLAPFSKRAVITLVGQDTGGDVMGMGEKVLGVMMGGRLELYGASRGKSWTHLDASAVVGATTLKLESGAGWAVGDKVVVASTDYSPNQAEEVVITAVNGDVVTVAPALKFAHFGQVQTFAGKSLESRAEVALLNRNITIRGDETSGVTGFGGHLMVMDTSLAQLENVEIMNMGQKNKLKRYPIHFHMQGVGSAGSFVKNSVIHSNFNRCVTIHGSGGIILENNAAYNTLGHCFFLEDGSETNNVFRGNLGLSTKRPDEGQRLLPTDKDPSTFWITNPNNVFENNVAAGSASFGFWIALPETATGPSATDARFAGIFPSRTALGVFKNNLAHSNDNTGLNVDGGPDVKTFEQRTTYYAARAVPSDPKSAIVPTLFEGFQAYKNRTRGVWLRGEKHTLENAVIADGAIGATFASHDTVVQNSLFIGETANKGTPSDYEKNGRVGLDGRTLPFPWETNFPIRGFEFYDGQVGAKNVTFVNFQPNAQRGAGGTSYLRFTDFHVDPRNGSEGLIFENANRVWLAFEKPEPTAPTDDGMDGYRSAVFLDKDGSLTGTANRSVVVNNPFLLNANCTSRADWSAFICNNPYARFIFENVSGNNAEISPVTITRLEDSNPSHKLWGTPNDNANTNFETRLIAQKNHDIALNGALPPRVRLHFRNRNAGDWVGIRVPWSGGTPSIYRDWWVDNRNKLSEVPLPDLAASSGDKYAVSGGQLHLKLQIKTDRDYAVLDVCQTDLCK